MKIYVVLIFTTNLNYEPEIIQIEVCKNKKDADEEAQGLLEGFWAEIYEKEINLGN